MEERAASPTLRLSWDERRPPLGEESEDDEDDDDEEDDDSESKTSGEILIFLSVMVGSPNSFPVCTNPKNTQRNKKERKKNKISDFDGEGKKKRRKRRPVSSGSLRMASSSSACVRGK